MSDTWHIQIEGQVQGVGFRPFVYKQAMEFGLTGWVNNTIDGVHCEFNAGDEKARQFSDALIENAPALSHITAHDLQKVQPAWFDAFRIIHSDDHGEPNLLLSPDFAMCDDCHRELFDSHNRRRGYPFITCTNCGPRYSIINTLPYDRERTTMASFGMCDICRKEYDNPLDRRYYSQTNSCQTCGISQSLYDENQQLLTSKTGDIINRITQRWQEGKIVALKGIGGYLLTCDATNQTVIERLRERKHRPTKPFALMYPGLESLEKDVILKSEGRHILINAVSPIVLTKVKNNPVSDICLQEIAPGLARLGVMIPYTPLYALLLSEFGEPIIATSGNISGSPIVYKNQKALEELAGIADAVLTNDRDIVVPQDDSVISFSPRAEKKIIHRRSRGLAPTYINPALSLPDQTILATGGMLKSSFTFLHRQNVFVSQYLGDLDHFDTQKNYRRVIHHFFELFDEKTEVVLADKHPDYFSTRFAEELSDEVGAPIKKYQHHRAHFAAVLGEHALLNSDHSILGVIWDGTGLGDDGQIWGGEFFTYDHFTFNRCGHFGYFDFIAGDKMPREPRISALCATHGMNGAETVLKDKFSDLEWKNYHTLLKKKDNLQTSSVGRLFDAVSSLLGLKDRQSYEGEAAMLLEKQARDYINKEGLNFSEGYLSESKKEALSTPAMMKGILHDVNSGVAKHRIAARFHVTLVQLVEAEAQRQETKKIAFSGGVFQNALLVDLIIHHLGDKYELYFHTDLSPNDENISFGQLMCYVVGSNRK